MSAIANAHVIALLQERNMRAENLELYLQTHDRRTDSEKARLLAIEAELIQLGHLTKENAITPELQPSADAPAEQAEQPAA